MVPRVNPAQPVLVLCIIALLPLAAPPQTNSRPCHNSTIDEFSPELAPKARAFLGTLQAALKVGNNQMVADLVHYPLNVYGGKQHRVIRNKAQLLREFQVLFPSKLRQAVEQQIPECLFANYQGVMIGDGNVWYEEQRDGTLKIKTLNL